jgi:forkhead box protein P
LGCSFACKLGKAEADSLQLTRQEQLQINLLQQSHLMQAAEKAGPKSQAAMQQLQLQQQQLISQLQLVQQRILLVRNPTFPLFREKAEARP